MNNTPTPQLPLTLIGRKRASLDPFTSPEVLERLAGDKNSTVRENVAAHPKAPLSALAQLAQDESEDVREAVACNSRTPARILEDLMKDEDVWVCSVATDSYRVFVQLKPL